MKFRIIDIFHIPLHLYLNLYIYQHHKPCGTMSLPRGDAIPGGDASPASAASRLLPLHAEAQRAQRSWRRGRSGAAPSAAELSPHDCSSYHMITQDKPGYHKDNCKPKPRLGSLTWSVISFDIQLQSQNIFDNPMITLMIPQDYMIYKFWYTYCLVSYG